VRILWLKTELLHPVDKGGKIRTYNMLRELKRDHQVTYLTLDDGTATVADRALSGEFCDQMVCVPHSMQPKFTAGFYRELLLNLFSPLPYAIKKYESLNMRNEILKQLGTNLFDVVICDFLAPAVNVPLNLSCTTILFQHNVEAVIWQRHHQVENNPFRKTYLYGQWRKMRRFERETCRRFDCVIAVSEDDRRQIEQDYSVKRVFDIPTGVDTDFFRPRNEETEPDALVFTGSMDWLPNEDAIRYFSDHVFPIIKQQVPKVTLTVVGRNPNQSLQELGNKDPSIVITGRVDDVRPYIERASVFIVPVRIGGGTRLKIYEAMAMEKPVVSTTVGAEGLPVKHGLELLVADTAEAFAESVVRLLRNRDFAGQIGQKAAKTVREHFSWRNVAEEFSRICETAVRERRSKVENAAISVGGAPPQLDASREENALY
jgi:sugar transferase (PEP-CTERM/EpsH1 system associated)